MEFIRPAGFTERRCIARDVLGLYGSIITLGTYSSPSIGETSTFAAVVKALKACVVQHPALKTTVQDAETERPRLAHMERLDLDAHIVWEQIEDSVENDIQHIERWLEGMHRSPWSDIGHQPQWRLYICEFPPPAASLPARFHAALATSHALADGMSGIAFHKTFLGALRALPNTPYNAQTSFDLALMESPALLPALDRAGYFPISWGFLLRPLLEHYLPKAIARILGCGSTAEGVWCGALERPSVTLPGPLLPTKVHVSIVPAHVLSTALAACRTHHVRLTGLINVLTARALASCLKSRNLTYHRFAMDTAIDLRRCLPDAKDRIANYASVVDDLISLDVADGVTKQDWETARRITDHLAVASASLRDQPVALLKYLRDYRQWTIEKAGKPAKSSFSTSNLGVFREDASHATIDGLSWTVEQLLFSQSADGSGAPFQLNLSSCAEGPFTIVTSWWPGMLGVEDEVQFMSEVVQKVVQLFSSLTA